MASFPRADVPSVRIVQYVYVYCLYCAVCELQLVQHLSMPMPMPMPRFMPSACRRFSRPWQYCASTIGIPLEGNCWSFVRSSVVSHRCVTFLGPRRKRYARRYREDEAVTDLHGAESDAQRSIRIVTYV